MTLRQKNKVKLTLALLLLAVFLVIIAYNTVVLVFQTLYPKSYSELVQTNAHEYGIDEALLYSLIETESGFNKDAVSSVGAMGLTQILPETFQWLQTKTGETLSDDALFEPEVSVRYGAYLMSILVEEFGSTETAVAAYHAGIGRVRQWLGDSRYSSDGKNLYYIPFDDTRAYVDKIMKTRNIYIELYDLQNTGTEDTQNVNS